MPRRKNDIAVHVEEGARYSLDESFDLFIRDCKLRNLAQGTIDYYTKELRLGLRMLGEEADTDDPAQITIDDIENRVILQQIAEGRKETAVNAKLRALRAFFYFLERRGIVDAGLASNIKLMKERTNVIETFSTKQVAQLIGAIDRRKFTGVRDYTIVLLLLETGIRLKEIAGIQLSHIELTEGRIRITEAKGGKERYVPIQTAVRRQLTAYIRLRGDLDHSYLFAGIDNQPLTRRQIQNRLHQLGEFAGIENVRVSPHTFRHTFAKMAVQNGANVFELQAILGHTTLDMVRKYVNLYSSDVAKGHSKFSPVQNLNIE